MSALLKRGKRGPAMSVMNRAFLVRVLQLKPGEMLKFLPGQYVPRSARRTVAKLRRDLTTRCDGDTFWVIRLS